MAMKCEQVWLEISNYVDGDVEAQLRSAMDDHFQTCDRCSSVLAGTRNVIGLYGDERMLEVPFGFSQRLQRRLAQNRNVGTRRSFLGWMVAATAALLVAGGFELGRASETGRPGLRSEHAHTAAGVPPEMMVVVSNSGKTFHLAKCDFIHDKARVRNVPAGQALQEGYLPCVRCLGKYLS